MNRLGQTIAHYWENIQGVLFSDLQEVLDPLTEKQLQLITILEVIRLEEFIPNSTAWLGRPQESRRAIARAFMAKTVYNLTTTRALLERLEIDKNLRRICGCLNYLINPKYGD